MANRKNKIKMPIAAHFKRAKGKQPIYYIRCNFADNSTKVYTHGGSANIAENINFRDNATQNMQNSATNNKDQIIKTQEMLIAQLKEQIEILTKNNDTYRQIIDTQIIKK